MNRHTALRLLVTKPCDEPEAIKLAAQALGLTRQAVYGWPINGHLPRSAADKVLATLARQRLAQRIAQKVAAGKRVSALEMDVITLPD
jgi:hypothetical protein